MEALAERKSTAKLTELLQIERRVQKKWEDEKVFEEDAPLPGTKEATYGCFCLFRVKLLHDRV
jgi:leucyl-tRNA synthetase